MPESREVPAREPTPAELEEILANLDLFLDMDELSALPLEETDAEESDDEP